MMPSADGDGRKRMSHRNEENQHQQQQDRILVLVVNTRDHRIVGQCPAQTLVVVVPSVQHLAHGDFLRYLDSLSSSTTVRTEGCTVGTLQPDRYMSRQPYFGAPKRVPSRP